MANRVCARAEGRSAFSEAYFQAKTVWQSVDDAPWGAGLVAGVTRKQRETHRGWENPFMVVPVSVKSERAAAAFHFNVGWSHDRVGGRMSLIKDPLELDLTVVTRPGGSREERFVSLGLSWQSGRFLP